jgi:lipopolysaccharide/colanic/teichoic acid biosynthesis glycosyltransferase
MVTQAVSATFPRSPALKPEISQWCHSRGKRALDICVGLPILAITLPLFLLIAICVKLNSRGPAVFRQKRVGRGGKEFQLLKFRTMTQAAEHQGPRLTCSGDARVTNVGRFLRKWKLDELPQLWNLLRGDMSLVGPRPDMAEFLSGLQGSEQHVLLLTPGITGWATLHFRNEEELLASIPQARLREVYVSAVLPQKIRLDLDYAANATLSSDCGIVLRTAFAIFK